MAAMQPTLQQLFQKAKGKQGSEGTSKPAAAGSSGVKRAAADEASKENRPPPAAAAAAAAAHAAGAKQPGGAAKPQRRSSSKQMFLDLGQKDFGASRCSVCGMMYAKGHEEDEKLHKSFHASALQGLKLQGWANERVLLSEPLQGRLLMVLTTDPAQHLKRVQQVCSFVERAHGMTPGWLLAAPRAAVFLYVSLQRRVVGMAVLEPLKQAYRVAGPPPAAAAAAHAEEADSLPAAAAVSQQQQQQQALPPQQPVRPPLQQLVWPGLHRSAGRSGGSAATSSSTGAAGRRLLSGGGGGGSAATSTGGGGWSARAGSCPSSLVAGAAQLMAATESAGDEETATTSQQQQQQDDSGLMPPPPAQQQQQQQQDTAASIGVAAAASGSGAARSGAAARSSPGAAPTAAAAAAAAMGDRCLLVDKRKAVRAMLGVRMVWVSAEQRRHGLATKLLDAARCNMVPGYVVPRNQLALTQPTSEGAALAAAFTGSLQFLVYGVE